jgi:hypothetical protein
MNEKSKSLLELSYEQWILDLAFLVYITSRLNELNTKLQGNGNLSLTYFQYQSFRN